MFNFNIYKYIYYNIIVLYLFQCCVLLHFDLINPVKMYCLLFKPMIPNALTNINEYAIFKLSPQKYLYYIYYSRLMLICTLHLKKISNNLY